MSVDRGFTWLDDETEALILVWGKDSMQEELSTAKRNFSVYERISTELSEVGFNRTAYQCREKIKRLRKEYHIARYCVQHNMRQKKPMKFYEQVDEVFNREREFKSKNAHSSPNFSIEYSQEERKFNPRIQHENSANIFPEAVVISGPSSSPDGGLKMRLRMKFDDLSYAEESNDDSNDTIIDDNENDSNKSSELPEQHPFSNKILSQITENRDDQQSVLHEVETHGDANTKLNSKSIASILNYDALNETDSSSSTDDDEPHNKRPRYSSSKSPWLQTAVEQITNKFISCQEVIDCRFLERIASLERERIKRNESLQKLWIDFEEKQRKEERQHEIKMITLFGEVVNQFIYGQNTNS